MKILMVRHSNVEDVRIQKYIKVFKKENFDLYFIGWKREKISSNKGFAYVDHRYLISSERINKFKKSLLTIFWYAKTILWVLRNAEKFDYIYCADFEAAFPVFIVKRVKKIKYIYDIYDQYDMRYQLPGIVASLVRFVDRKLRSSAHTVIHVDENRLGELDFLEKTIVIKNSPMKSHSSVENYATVPVKSAIKLAVTGYLSAGRGLDSILKYASDNPDIHFLIAGSFQEKQYEEKFQSLDNCHYFGMVSQERLFSLLRDVNGIFSLYDPSVKINQLAASNKVYDSMCLGIPIIINFGLQAVQRIKEYGIGIIIPYIYEKDAWDVISVSINDSAYCKKVKTTSLALFLDKYCFEKQVLSLLKRL